MDRARKHQNVSHSMALLTALDVVILAWVCLLISTPAVAQNIVVGAPTTGASNSFQPAGGFSLNGSRGQFRFSGGQSSSRSISSQSPVMTISNGGTGTLINAIQRPFVIGYVPVVGGFQATYPGMYTSPAQIPSLTYPLHQKIRQLGAYEELPPATNGWQANLSDDGDCPHLGAVSSTATRPDIGVNAIRRRQAALDAAAKATVAEFVAKAEQAESHGNISQAIRWIDEARRSSQGALRKQFESRLRGLRARADSANATK